MRGILKPVGKIVLTPRAEREISGLATLSSGRRRCAVTAGCAKGLMIAAVYAEKIPPDVLISKQASSLSPAR
jgi:hypothetical protein